MFKGKNKENLVIYYHSGSTVLSKKTEHSYIYIH